MSLHQALQDLQRELERQEAKVDDIAKANTYDNARHSATQTALGVIRQEMLNGFEALHVRLDKLADKMGVNLG